MFKYLKKQRHRIAITGFSKSGKSALISSLAGHLMAYPAPTLELGTRSGSRRKKQPPMPIYPAFRKMSRDSRENRWNSKCADFPVEECLSQLRSGKWPERTTELSVLELEGSFKLCSPRPESSQSPSKTLAHAHITFHDLPGERFSDCVMLKKDFAAWSDEQIGKLTELGGRHRPPQVTAFLQLARSGDPSEDRLIGAYKTAQVARIARHHQYVSPSTIMLDEQGRRIWDRFGAELKMGDFEKVANEIHSGLLGQEFAPLPVRDRQSPLLQKMEDCYNAYRQELARTVLSFMMKCDSVAILFDVAHILRGGPDVLDDSQAFLSAICETLEPDSHMRTVWSRITGRSWSVPRVRKLAVVANQIDRFHEGDREAVVSLTQAFGGGVLADLPRRIRWKFMPVSAVQCAHRSDKDDCLRVRLGQRNEAGKVPVQEIPVARLPKDWHQQGGWEWPREWDPDDTYPSPPGFPRFPQPILPNTRRALPYTDGLDELARFLFDLPD